jgi:Family of unknown function (DUF5343)
VAVTENRAGPYAPASAVLEIIDRRRHRGLAVPISSDVLGRAGISASLIPRTLQALQTLDLIGEDGQPTPTFEGIRLAPEAEHKKRLEEWLKAAYADVFAFVDPAKDDETSIRDAFRNYQPIGQQARMVTLFQGLCAAAGIISAEKPNQPSTPRPPRSSWTHAARRQAPKPATVMKAAPTTSSSIGGLPAPLAGLLASLPTDGNGWTGQQRDKFMSTFSAVLDFCIPVVEDDRAAKQGGGPE